MIYLNGEFMALSEAKISVLDRGFIFGDGVYEVIPVYSRRAFRLPEHLARLQVTRGVAKRDHTFTRGVKPTVFIMSNPLVTPSAEVVKTGGAAIVLPDFRWLRCDIKTTSLLGLSLIHISE